MIKSKNLFLLFSQVTTFSIFFFTFQVLISYTQTLAQKSIHSPQLSPLLFLSQFQELSSQPPGTSSVALHCQSMLPSPISAHEAVSSLSLLPRRCTSAVLSRLNSYIFKHFDGFFFFITHKGPKITHTKYKAGWP